MTLIKNVENKLWNEYSSYKEVRNYISKWHESHGGYFNDYTENFSILVKDTGDIDLNATLNNIDAETLIKIAIDLGIETPDFIPSIPTFKNSLKSDYKAAYSTFEKACKQVNDDPSLAIGLANSSLESIIKEIIKDERIERQLSGKETLKKLIETILKEFKLHGKDFPIEVKTIGSSFISLCNSVEKLRSEKTNFHGKTEDEIIINDKIYANLVVNSVTSLGIFLIDYYENKYPKPQVVEEEEHDDLPF